MSIRTARGLAFLATCALLLALTGACDTGESTVRPPARHHPKVFHPKVSHPRATRTPMPSGSSSPATSGPLPVPVAAGTGQIRALLDHLRRQPRPHGTLGYHRDAFGDDWIDTDGNGCNQRDDVLLRDAVRRTVTVAQQGACDHDVLAGTWRDPYTGRTLHFTDLKDLSQAMAIQIDHVVPLAEAWVSGARHWSDDRRRAFANDLSELLAVDGPTNESKGDGDPAAWRPRKDYQCTYATRWIRIKHRWDLAADDSEVRALREMLGSC